MSTQSNQDAKEIETIISTIKSTVNEKNVRIVSWTIEEVQNHLGRLKDYLAHLDNALDFLSVVCDVLDSTNHLLRIPKNHLESKLTLKSNIASLEKEFGKYLQKTDLFRQLQFVSLLDSYASHSETEDY